MVFTYRNNTIVSLFLSEFLHGLALNGPTENDFLDVID